MAVHAKLTVLCTGVLDNKTTVEPGSTTLLGMNEPKAKKNESATLAAAQWSGFESIANRLVFLMYAYCTNGISHMPTTADSRLR
jgi:hypothetical protein